MSGPSGVGKGSVIAAVRARHPDVWVSVSVTTRPPRPGEKSGVHYYFVDEGEFTRMVVAGALLEWASYAGFRYGTPRIPVEERLAEGRQALLEIELEGARQVRAAMPSARLVFLAPPSWPELKRRLAGRSTEDGEAVSRRLAQAQLELDAADEFDEVIVNDEIEKAADRLVTLLHDAVA